MVLEKTKKSEIRIEEKSYTVTKNRIAEKIENVLKSL
jgi:hypothetical protein